MHGPALRILARGGAESVCREASWQNCFGRRALASRRALVAAAAMGASKGDLVVELNVPDRRLRRWIVKTLHVACCGAAAQRDAALHRPACQQQTVMHSVGWLLEDGDNVLEAGGQGGEGVALTRMTLAIQRVSFCIFSHSLSVGCHEHEQ